MLSFAKKRILIFFAILAVPLLAEQPKKERTLSEVAASSNDWVITKGQSSALLKPFSWVTSRAISLTLFPACMAVDLAVLTAKQAHETSHIILDKDPVQRQVHLANFRKNSEAIKSTALGLVTSPLGAVSPDLVTHHFIPEKIQTYEVVPYGKLYKAKAHMARPNSIEEVQAIVLEAKRSGKTVSVLGKLMCQGKQTISNSDWNVAIDTSNLNKIYIDPALKIAKVGAGTTWKDLQNVANQYGLAVRVMQASNIFSIGGSISANCHGWDFKAGCLRNTIISLTVVNAEGATLEVTPNQPLFNYIVGGYGGFGVIVEATVSLTDNVQLIEYGIEISPRHYVDYFNKHILHNKEVDMHLYRLSLEPKRLFHSGVAVSYQRRSDQPTVAFLKDEQPLGGRLDRIKLHTIRRLNWLCNLAWKTEKNDAMAIKIMSRNEVMRPPINPIFNNSKIDSEWLQEYFVKGEDLSDFLAFLGHLLQKNKVKVLNASVRFVKHDPNTKLSYASQGNRFAIVLFFNQKLSPVAIQSTKSWVREVIDYLIAHEGSYYLPYQHFATQEQFQACYPKAAEVIAFKSKVDPDQLFHNGFYEEYLSSHDHSPSLFRTVFSRVGGQRAGMRDFLNNIFMQLDEQKFFALVDNVLENPNLNDEQIYTTLYKKIGQAKYGTVSGLRQTLRSLKTLKNEIGDQTAELMGSKSINGYVEIGYTGRMIRPLRNRLDLQGPYYVINDNEAFSDYIEAGFPRPYDKFLFLNDYEPISESDIPSNSVDLICMYIGLHHAPKDKLEGFLQSIVRVIRPGGSFILMDHDASTKELQDLVDVVHSVFNLGTGVEPFLNAQEIRDFQSLAHWIQLVEQHGLVHYNYSPLIRKGDPTLNALVRFDKPIQNQTATIDVKYQRPLLQTYLTAPEWQNVRAAQRYASFVENQPAYRYPYLSEIGGFWSVYGQSWKAAQQNSSFSAVAFSDYNLMNLFVGSTMTLEYGVKGLVSAPILLLEKIVGGPETASKTIPSDRERVRSLKAYGKYIETTPFYSYPYFRDIGKYWRTYLQRNKSLSARLKGLILGTGMTLEYSLKGLVSAPMALIYGSDALKEAETIHLLIKDPKNELEWIDPNIEVVGVYPEQGLKHIQAKRYMPFTELMVNLAHHSEVSCVDIAGHAKIQVDIKSPQPFLPNYSGMKKLYNIPAPTDSSNRYMALEVDVDRLLEVIRLLSTQNIQVMYIHDY